MSSNVTLHVGGTQRAERERRLDQRGCVVWLTGLSGSGKSTIAHALEARLMAAGKCAYVLDGDNLRHGLNADLGFSAADRAENIRRVGEVATLFADAGLIAIAALISPYRADRDRARACAPAGRFLEVFVDVALETCEARDPKGLYQRARRGEISDFTGVSAPYERPLSPEVHLRSETIGVDEAVEIICAILDQRGVLSARIPEAPCP